MYLPQLPNTWSKHLKSHIASDSYKNLDLFLEKSSISKVDIYPNHNDIYNIFKICKLPDIKVVILGQDPYHGTGQAHGLSFSVPKGTKIPPSLVNIYKELNTDIGMKIPTHGYLKDWVEQGVFLLNTVLTVEKAKAGSHRKKGWEDFTNEVIKLISNECTHVVFILWGAPAQKKETLIDHEKHLILKAPHPSPLSSYRGFFGCKHFSKTNDFLTLNGIDPIDWNIINRED